MALVKVVKHGVVVVGGLEYGPEDGPFNLNDNDAQKLISEGVVAAAGEVPAVVAAAGFAAPEVSIEDWDLPDNVIEALIEANYCTDTDVSNATDEELRAIKGIGPSTLRAIRSAVVTKEE